MERSLIGRALVTFVVSIGIAVGPAAHPASAGALPRGAGKPSAWRQRVEQACTTTRRAIERTTAEAPDVLASGPDVSLSDLSETQRKDVAAFFTSLSTVKARFGKQLGAITPDKASAKTYGDLTSAIKTESSAYRSVARKIRSLKTGQPSDDVAVALATVPRAEERASELLAELGITCEAVSVSAESATPASRATACYSKSSALVEVPCAEPHDFEFITKIDAVFPAEAPYPDVDEALAIADKRCQPEFEQFVGLPLVRSSRYNLSYIIPSQDEWAQGNRSVDCYVAASEKGTQLTGSAQGTKR